MIRIHLDFGGTTNWVDHPGNLPSSRRGRKASAPLPAQGRVLNQAGYPVGIGRPPGESTWFPLWLPGKKT